MCKILLKKGTEEKGREENKLDISGVKEERYRKGFERKDFP